MKSLCVLMLLVVIGFISYGKVDSTKFIQLSESFVKYTYQDTDKTPGIVREIEVITYTVQQSVRRVAYLYCLGIAKRMTRDFTDSIKILNQQVSKHLFEAIGIADFLKIENLDSYSLLGDYYKGNKNYQKAIPYHDKPKLLAMAKESRGMHRNDFNGLSVCYENTVQFKKNSETDKSFVVLSNTLNGIQRGKEIRNLGTKYDLNAKQDTIRRRDELIGVKNKQLNRERKLRFVSLGFIVLFLILSCLLYCSYRKLKKRNLALSVERKSLTQEKQKLQEINTTKNKLFAMLSHDLRSPISSLTSKLALYNEEGPSKQLQETLVSLSNIRLIMNNLLKWSSLRIKDDVPHFEEVNIGVLIDSVVSQMRSQITGKDITILRMYNHTCAVRTDEYYMQIVLRNLLSNAVKFTPRNGFIRINTSETKDNAVCVEIRDTGMGIPKEKLATLFFYPTSSKGTSGETGSGLGLTLCKELVDKVGGTIQVQSKLSVGSQFTISLPVYFEN